MASQQKNNKTDCKVIVLKYKTYKKMEIIYSLFATWHVINEVLDCDSTAGWCDSTKQSQNYLLPIANRLKVFIV
jgi:hypothetical protein